MVALAAEQTTFTIRLPMHAPSAAGIRAALELRGRQISVDGAPAYVEDVRVEGIELVATVRMAVTVAAK